ncbi:MAG: TrkA family potassium uptake protein [Hadesarchaea archaeon]|nr:TrkA family potassium uptake protein [Hadesarchaea archaeon]
MYIIIVGGGRTGKQLAERLMRRDHEVVIVEIDEKRAHELAAELDTLIINGSGADIDVLKDAGAEKADALVTVAETDEVNFMASKMAKKLGIPRVVSRINQEKHSSMFEDLGIDAAISFVSAAVTLYEKAVTGPGMYGLLGVGGGKGEVVEVTVQENSDVVGKTIKEIDCPESCSIAMITRKDQLIPPRGNTEMMNKDQVTIVGKEKDVIELARKLRGK